MGILRSDRVSGLGGANAINGSAFFPQNTYINVEAHSDFDLSGDFTVEMWVRNLAGPEIALYQRQIASKNYFQSGSDGNWYFGLNQFPDGELYFYSYDGQGSAESVSGNIATPDLDRWYHIAMARSGSTLKMFLDGSEEASGTVSKGLDDGGNNGLFIGGISKNKGTDSYGDHYGWISNLRIIKGRALYTSDFTVPTGRLEKTSDTVLLCFQSPGNVLEEKTGKILSHNNHDTPGASKEVSADRLAPDVGEDHGTTFADNTRFNTLSYMVPPGGTTAERGRGRAVFAGGYAQPGSPGAGTKNIDYISIQSGGISQDFGTLSEDRKFSAGLASATRGVFGGSDGTPAWVTGTMEYVTIATTSNTTTFGDMTQVGGMVSAHSNNTRGLFFSVWDANTSGSSHKKHIDYITIATAGNSSDFGELSVARPEASGFGSSTRGICAGGYDALSPNNPQDTIDYVTIATTGNATDFGNLTVARQAPGSASSSTRGVIAGGYASPAWQNTIDYVTIATTGNATDFGDLVTALFGQFVGNCSDKIRGVFAGGKVSNPTYTNSIDYVTIATTGNTQDFGDLILGTVPHAYGSVCSDSHGGIS